MAKINPRVTVGVFGLSLFCVLTCQHTNVSAATMSHEEQVVRDTYAKVSLLCGFPPVANAAFKQLNHESVNTNQLSDDVQNAVPKFVLSNFTVGNLSDIADRSLSDLATTPSATGTDALTLQSKTHSYTDNGNRVQWYQMSVAWGDDQQLDAIRTSGKMDSKLGELLTQFHGDPDTTETLQRYAAFTVDLYYQNRTTGSYKAIFFFGKDKTGKDIVLARDMVAQHPLNEAILQQHVYPAGILHSRLRDTPAMAQWIEANRLPDAACSSSTSELCCADNKCGIRAALVSRDLATPLPDPK